MAGLWEWVRDDYVVLIPPPSAWVPEVGTQVRQLAESVHGKEAAQAADQIMAEDRPTFLDAIADGLADLDADHQEQMLVNFLSDKTPLKLTESEATEVRERLRGIAQEPNWVKSAGVEGFAHLGGGLLGPEVAYLQDGFNVYVSSSRSLGFLRHNQALGFEQDFAVDRAVRALPVEFPSRPSLDVVYDLRTENRLSAFRQTLQRHFDEFAGVDGAPEELIVALEENVYETFMEYEEAWKEVSARLRVAVGSAAIDQAVPGTDYLQGQTHPVTMAVSLLVGAARLAPHGLKYAKLRRNPLYVIHKLR